MNLNYAVDRLYEVGWLPTTASISEFERLNDGRRYPTVQAVQKHFGLNGLKLSIKPKSTFKCYEATWCPLDEEADPGRPMDDRHGTVIGACEKEAAVYAMAQLLATKAEAQLAAI